MSVREINGIRIIEYPADGTVLATEGDAADLLGFAWSNDAEMVAVPVDRLSPDFLRLSTRLAGAVFQKFQNYSMRLAIVGDISEAVAASRALHDFVYETNQIGRHRFVTDMAELERTLA